MTESILSEQFTGYWLLQTRILSELEELERAEEVIRRHWQARLHVADPDVFTNSVALNLHSFYSGLERIFEIIAVQIDGGKPESSHWHAELLRQMTLDLPGIRPAVLSRQSAGQLDELRCFGHRVRNIYAANLAPQRMRAVVETLTDLWQDVRQQMKAFAAWLDALSRADENNE